jgi:uncharacterized protein YndB with AHSA1/START domain
MPDILHRIGINASPEKVYDALSQQQGLAGWWTVNTKASPTVGTINQFRFGDSGFNDMKFVELVPGKRVKWHCVDGAKEWIGTELIFELQRKNGATIVIFPHCGWRERGWERRIRTTSTLASPITLRF